VKFGVEDVRVVPFSDKSLVLYSNFIEGRKGTGVLHGLD
jgi:hypothetical protein